jgi:hypothetical protein
MPDTYDQLSFLDPFGQKRRRESIRAGLDSLAQPQDDNVWKARLLGGLAGAGRAAYDILAGGDDDMMDPGIGMTPAASIGQKSLPVVAKEAYGAVKGLKGLYSRLTNSIVSQMPDRAFPSKIASIAKSGSSAEEQSVRKFSDFLAGRDPSKVVEKADVLAHLEANPIELEHKVLSGGGNTKYPEYQVPGGENYQENLFQASIKPIDDPYAAARQQADDDPVVQYWDDMVTRLRQEANDLGFDFEADPTEVQALQDRLAAARVSLNEATTRYSGIPGLPRLPPIYKAPHFDSPNNQNLLVHSRANDRSLAAPSRNPKYDRLTQEINELEAADADITGMGVFTPDMAARQALEDARLRVPETLPPVGGKGRLIEEIQSDLHQTGKKAGYGTPPDPVAINAKKSQLAQQLGNIGRQYPGVLEPNFAGDPEVRAFAERLVREVEALDVHPVPDLPFKDSYADLALKQQLLDVADNPELEWLGILGPEEQIARFPSEKNVKGMRHFYGQEYPNKLAKLLKPFGGTVEQTTLPRTEPPAGFATHGDTIRTVEPSGQQGGQVASVWPKNTGTRELMQQLDQRLEANAVGFPGPDISLARLTPEMKAMIKRVGFPAMAAMFGLRGAFAGDQPPR